MSTYSLSQAQDSLWLARLRRFFPLVDNAVCGVVSGHDCRDVLHGDHSALAHDRDNGYCVGN